MGGQGSLADGLEAAALSGFAIGQDPPAPAQVAGVTLQAADARGSGNGIARKAALACFAGMMRVGIGPGDKSGENALVLSFTAR